MRRRVHQELGLDLDELRVLLPGFGYRAEMDGVVEHELCPVLVATTATDPRPDPAEVEEVHWEPWADFRAGVLDGSRDVSPWCRLQVEALPAGPAQRPRPPPRRAPPSRPPPS